MRVTVLGPQRRPTVDQVMRDLDVDGPVATITAGWQEREPDDAELMSLLGGRGTNLALYARFLDVLDQDVDFARASVEHRAVLDDLQQLYLAQLDHALRAWYAVAQRTGGRPRTTAAALADALAVVRLVDENHLERVRGARRDFYAAWRPQDRPIVAEHREAIGDVLRGSAGVVIAGGHVGVLTGVLHLFLVTPSMPGTVVAWSAGAMALTERIITFHDRAPQGPSHAEVYDDGVDVLPGVVLLPHARRRLLVEDHVRMSSLAQRFAPARCLVLDDGVRYDFGPDGALPPNARLVMPDGTFASLEPA